EIIDVKGVKIPFKDYKIKERIHSSNCPSIFPEFPIADIYGENNVITNYKKEFFTINNEKVKGYSTATIYDFFILNDSLELICSSLRQITKLKIIENQVVESDEFLPIINDFAALEKIGSLNIHNILMRYKYG
ncbi:hypothetical protein ACFL1H_08120, partial [Nanoarchaeota archaeon]